MEVLRPDSPKSHHTWLSVTYRMISDGFGSVGDFWTKKTLFFWKCIKIMFEKVAFIFPCTFSKFEFKDTKDSLNFFHFISSPLEQGDGGFVPLLHLMSPWFGDRVGNVVPGGFSGEVGFWVGAWSGGYSVLLAECPRGGRDCKAQLFYGRFLFLLLGSHLNLAVLKKKIPNFYALPRENKRPACPWL